MNLDQYLRELQAYLYALHVQSKEVTQGLRAATQTARALAVRAEQRETTEPVDPPIVEPPIIDPPVDPPVDPPIIIDPTDPPIVVDPGSRTYQAWAGSWSDDKGNMQATSNGQSGLAAALNAGTKNGEHIRVIWHGSGSLEVANNRPGTKRAVDSSKPINATVTGGALTGLFIGEEYLGGAVDRSNPAVEQFIYESGTLDLRNATTPYPVVSAVNTRQGMLGMVNIEVLTVGGVGSKVKSAIRFNGAANYEINGITCHGGTNEYVAYVNYGPGESRIIHVSGVNNGRGIVQAVYRTTENRFAGDLASAHDRLEVGHITAKDNGGKDGSSAVSITGWGEGAIYVHSLDVDTHWNAGGLSLRYDIKQADVTGGPGSWQRIGPGFLVPDAWNVLRAHNHVTADLSSSTIHNGNDNPGQAHKSSREQVIIDSCHSLTYLTGSYTGKGSGDKLTDIGREI